jgi:hypothetical protein
MSSESAKRRHRRANDRSVVSITGCAYIPEALEKLEEYCKREGAEKSAQFALLYPIYLEAMDPLYTRNPADFAGLDQIVAVIAV